jgi:hypothetical protein
VMQAHAHVALSIYCKLICPGTLKLASQ